MAIISSTLLGKTIFPDNYVLAFYDENGGVIAQLYQGERKLGAFTLEGLSPNLGLNYETLSNFARSKINLFLMNHSIQLEFQKLSFQDSQRIDLKLDNPSVVISAPFSGAISPKQGKPSLNKLALSARSFSQANDLGKESILETQPNIPFFSIIQRYKSNFSDSTPLPIFFDSWFRVLKEAYTFIQSEHVSEEIQQKLFFYLAHRYHYNATFRQEENLRLGYQTSPLALSDRNSYLRSNETIWMQLASELAYQLLNTNDKEISIIWIDHVNFLSFLGQFYQVVKVSALKFDEFQPNLDLWLKECRTSFCPLYIFVEDLPKDPQARKKEARKFADEKLSEMTTKLIENEVNQHLDYYFHLNLLPIILREAAHLILSKGGLGKEKARFNTRESVAFLKNHYGKYLREKQQQWLKKIRSSLSNGKWEKDLIAYIFKLYRNFSHLFAPNLNFKKSTDVENFLKDLNVSNYFTNQICNLLSNFDSLRFEDYIEAFQEDIKCIFNFSKIKQNAEKAVCIFYVEQFEGLSALVFPHKGKGVNNLSSILGNVGYSPDSISFLRVLIQGYSSFFPRPNQASFLEAGIQTKSLCLSKMESIVSSALSNLNCLDGYSYSVNTENVFANFDKTLIKLKSSKNPHQRWFKLYKDFLLSLLSPIAKARDVNKNVVFAVIKITEGIQAALQHQSEIHLFIRDIQDVLEAWMLYIDINPLIKDPVQIFQEALPSKPAVIHFTPYAMRSFTRILQAYSATNLANSKADRLRIQVFNQIYFELLTNMERFQGRAEIKIAQSDAQIEDCDLYFIDIHPNNAAEARLFSHDILEILETLKSLPCNRLRTLVVDITLSALSSNEIKNLLNKAKSLIDSGQLNLILVQSLTKFSQLGLDKLSAGFLAAYNNQQNWKTFNNQLNVLQSQEPVDPLNLQFFTCLTYYAPNFQKDYITQINENTQSLYHMVLERYHNLNLSLNKNILALTCNIDLQTCYLAFNSKGILSLFDPYSDVFFDDNEISSFTKDIIKKLFIPLAEWLDLPLTERMSIGFPLSSINECTMDTIRLTVGLEEELLPKYADIITYICFIMNREREPKKTFFGCKQKESEKPYPEREKYFIEKVKIFKAMYLMPGKIGDPVEIQELLEDWKDSRRIFKLNEGIIQVTYDFQCEEPSKGLLKILNEEKLYVHFDKNGDIPLADQRITPFIKCLLASCLTQRQSQHQDNTALNMHNVNLTTQKKLTPQQEPTPQQQMLDRLTISLHFNAFFYIREDNTDWQRFGYYNILYREKNYKISFDFKDKKLWLVLNEKWFNESSIFIKKGHELLPATWLDMEEKWRLFKQAPYKPLREMPFTGFRWEPDPNDIKSIKLEFSDERPIVIIERDKIAFKLDGASLYCRNEAKNLVQLDIDFWSIKNSFQSQFLKLLFCYMAFYKENIPFEFVTETYSRVTLSQKSYNPKKLKQIAKEILDCCEEILFQFDNIHPKQKDWPLSTNPRKHEYPLSQFCISNSVIPFPSFMERLFSFMKKLKEKEIKGSLNLYSASEVDQNSQRNNPISNVYSKYKIPLFALGQTSLITSSTFIYQNWNEQKIASNLWKDTNTRISDQMIAKVQEAHNYLEVKGFELCGIDADGNCFFSAFLKSYQTLISLRKIPLLDEQKDLDSQISFLRQQVADQYKNSPKGMSKRLGEGTDRVESIRKDKEWVNSEEGCLLAKVLEIPIRILTVNDGRDEISQEITTGISDTLFFLDSDKNLQKQEWSHISNIQRVMPFIFIVDLGGHFVYAKKISDSETYFDQP